ncbi:hypothetical protein GCM10010909_10010 [Acidocella aquatica]|uniref:Uncharacterized protein n=1 Tax=Acidocella aquatica TaxID=1922313 RepID=A0ABQ6A1L7_9PROT|nr:hypothetical protein [Acidocella aquatica]GLR66321.1 hypothetical protein GCM10010909_10010 [Acidocella aquatica]
MKSIVGLTALPLVAAGIILFFAVPLIAENTGNECQALEKYTASNAARSVTGSTTGPIYGMLNGLAQSVATGEATSAAEANAHPNIPVNVSCAYDFWKAL